MSKGKLTPNLSNRVNPKISLPWCNNASNKEPPAREPSALIETLSSTVEISQPSPALTISPKSLLSKSQSFVPPQIRSFIMGVRRMG